jgi:hypothetical protein
VREQARTADPDDALVEAVAHRVIALLGEQATDGGALAELLGSAIAARSQPADRELLTVAQIAREYGVHPSWVYAHQRELGAIRLGTGPKPRLRFDPETVAGACPVIPVRPQAGPPARRRRRRRLTSRKAPAERSP